MDLTEQRLEKLLQGAFSDLPAPLKDTAKRNSKSRSVGKKKLQRRSARQRKKGAA